MFLFIYYNFYIYGNSLVFFSFFSFFPFYFFIFYFFVAVNVSVPLHVVLVPLCVYKVSAADRRSAPDTDSMQPEKTMDMPQ